MFLSHQYQYLGNVILIFMGIMLQSTIIGQDTPKDVTLQYQALISVFDQNLADRKHNDNINRFQQLTEKPIYQQFNCYQKGKIFDKIGKTHYRLLNDASAVRFYKDSLLQVWEGCELQTEVEEAEVYYKIAISLQFLNKIDEALSYLNPALELFETVEDYDPKSLARKYRGAGISAKNANDLALAELYFSKALEIFKNEKNYQLAEVYNDLGTLKIELGLFVEANELLTTALRVHKMFVKNEKQLLLARIYHNLGSSNVHFKNYQQAEIFGQQELSISTSLLDTFRIMGSKELLGVSKMEQGEYDLAENYFIDIIVLSQSKMHISEYVKYIYRSHENLADLYLRKGNLNEALLSINQAIEINVSNGVLDKIYNPIIENIISRDEFDLLKALVFKAKILATHTDTIHLNDALLTHEKIDTLFINTLQGLKIEESQIDLLTNLKDHFGNAMIDHYGDAIKIAVQLFDLTGDEKYKELAYHYSAKTKAIVLVNNIKLSEQRKKIHSVKLIMESDSLAKLSNELKIEFYNSNENSQDSIRGEILKVERAVETLDIKMKEEQPEYYRQQQSYSNPLSIQEIQSQLNRDQLLVEFFISKNNLYSFWISSNDFKVFTFQLDEELVEKFIDFRDACSQADFWTVEKIKKEGFDLYAILFSDLLYQGEINRLTIIPDGFLHGIPFEALSFSSADNELHFMVEEYAISSSYSNQFLFDVNSSNPETYIGFATSYSNSLNKNVVDSRASKTSITLGSLAFAVQEIERSAEVFNGKGYYEEQASKENFMEESANADILHLSLHGLVDYDVPENSCVIFDDRSSDFVLRASEMYTHPINSNLVILSSCFSATGKIFRGEGVQGMSKAFLLAGSKTVISSLWEAAEISSMNILPNFLGKIKKGTPKDIALQEAKRQYLDTSRPSLQHPFYWANYIMIGNVASVSSAFSLSTLWMIMSGLILLILALFIYKYMKN